MSHAHDIESGLHQEVPQSGPERPAQAYSEETFRHFLSIERKRAERSGRPVLLLLMDFDNRNTRSESMPLADPAGFFSAVAGSVREIDIIGWYRAHTVAGVVLTQRACTLPQDTAVLITTRVVKSLRERLPAYIGDRIQVRSVQLRCDEGN